MTKALAIVHKLLPLYSLLAHQRLLDATMPSEMQKITRMRTRIRDALGELVSRLD